MTSRAVTQARVPARVAALLCAPGCCALIYQVAWLRLLRLIFGGSIPSSVNISVNDPSPPRKIASTAADAAVNH